MTASSVDIALFAGKVGLVFFVILTLAAYLVFAERRILAWVQDRKGPNRVGPFGVLQPLADGLKALTKEDVVPRVGDKWVHFLAPLVLVVPVFLALAVLPIGDLFTMGPDDALAAVRLLRPKAVLPSHFGAWPLIAQDGPAWAAQVQQETGVRAIALKPGESFEF